MPRLARLVMYLLVAAAVLGVDEAGATAQTGSGLIAFTSDRDGNSEVYVVNSAGGAPLNLTRNSASDHSPTWSPDGSAIAFISDRSGNPDIWLMNADGFDPVNLTNSPEKESDPAWSPAGDLIAYAASLEASKPDGSVEVVLPSSLFVKLVRGGVSRLTMPDAAAVEWSRDAGDGQPAWSPNGKTIAFTRRYFGGTPTAQTAAVFTVPADGSEPAAHLAPGAWRIDELDWSPDGASIVWGQVGPHSTWGRLRRLDVASGVHSDIDVPLDFTHYVEPSFSSDGPRWPSRRTRSTRNSETSICGAPAEPSLPTG
jgi:dipeptidyl aminopeptidase/acylaminoacyl peptidase